MKLKRIILTILAAALILTALSACKGNTGKEEKGSSAKKNSSAVLSGDEENEESNGTQDESNNEESAGSNAGTTGSGASAVKSGAKSVGGGSSKAADTVKHPDYINPTGFPIVKKSITLEIMVNCSASQNDFSKVKMFQAYEQKTGIKIKWINIPSGTTREKVNMAFASNSLPDAFMKCGSILDNTAQYTYAKDGAILDLTKNNMLKNYAPNFYSFYSKNSGVKTSLTFAGGAVYSFPQGVETVPNKVAGKLFINNSWVSLLGAKMPTTTNEFYELLKRFKNEIPAKIGKKSVVPLSSPNFNYITYMLYGAFGLGNRGVHETYVDFDAKSGKPRLIGATDEYKSFLQYCKKLYDEKLLDNSIFTMSDSKYVAQQSEGTVGAFCYTNLATIPDSIGANFKGIEAALKGPDGHQFWYPVRSDLHSSGAFVITTKNKYPEATMRWVDYFYSDEGNLLYNYGVEGESHVKTADGYKFVQSVYDAVAKGSVTFDAAVAPHVAVGGSNPIITKDKLFYGREMDPIPAAAAGSMTKYYPSEIWPLFIFTPAENRELSIIRTDVQTYVDKMRSEFITGKTSFDKWDTYLKTLKNMELERMLEIYNAAYKRMK